MLSWSLPWELMRFVCTHESHEIAEGVPREEGDRPWQSLLPLGSRAPPQSEADDPWAPAIHTWSYGAPWSSHAWLDLSLPSVEHAAHPSVPPAPSAPTARNPKVNHEPGLRRPRCSSATRTANGLHMSADDDASARKSSSMPTRRPQSDMTGGHELVSHVNSANRPQMDRCRRTAHPRTARGAAIPRLARGLHMRDAPGVHG